MVQHYRYGDPAAAQPEAGIDGSRVIAFFIFNTGVHVHVYPGDSEDVSDPAVQERLDTALEAFRAACCRYEHLFSRTRPDSDISRAHAAAPAAVPVAPETADLVTKALAYCARSQGHFDITMGTITSLWDFHTGVVPSSLALARALPHVGYERIVVAEEDGVPMLAITDPQTVLDLGGIAKGYIADELAGVLRAHGVERFAMNLGGNVLIAGGRPEDCGHRPPVHVGDPWKIGVVNPFDSAHNRAVIALADGSVVTSGTHERRFTRGGVTYHHIIDPATGMPAHTDVASATIVAARSLDCDGWSTTAFMLGMDAALAFIEDLEGVEAVLVSEADEVRWTSGIADKLRIVPTLPQW